MFLPTWIRSSQVFSLFSLLITRDRVSAEKFQHLVVESLENSICPSNSRHQEKRSESVPFFVNDRLNENQKDAMMDKNF